MRGRYWVIEQYIYAMYFYKMKDDINISTFGKDVKLISCLLKDNFKLPKKLASYIHYLPQNKNEFYDKYVPALDEYLRNKDE